MDGVMGGWRKLHKKELCDSCSLQSVIKMIKTKRMRWKGHAARRGEGHV
jgi:hypothetical protein